VEELELKRLVMTALWMHRKFGNAVKQQMETCAELSDLLNLTNPHLADGCKYKTGFLMRQWKKQHKFQSTHTQEDNNIRLKLVKLYKDKAFLDLLR
jgi:hypothetical protein